MPTSYRNLAIMAMKLLRHVLSLTSPVSKTPPSRRELESVLPRRPKQRLTIAQVCRTTTASDDRQSITCSSTPKYQQRAATSAEHTETALLHAHDGHHGRPEPIFTRLATRDNISTSTLEHRHFISTIDGR